MKHHFMEETIKYSEIVTVLAQLIYPGEELPPAKIKIRRRLRTARDNKEFSAFKIDDVSYVYTHEFFNWAALKWGNLLDHIEISPGEQVASSPMTLPPLTTQGFMASLPSDKAQANEQHAKVQHELYTLKAELDDANVVLNKHYQKKEKRREDGRINGPKAWTKVKEKL